MEIQRTIEPAKEKERKWKREGEESEREEMKEVLEILQPFLERHGHGARICRRKMGELRM